MAKKENTQKNGRAHDLWIERKRAFNAEPDRKEHQLEYRIMSLENKALTGINEKQEKELDRFKQV